MKILLLGELSGVHKELREALVRQGHTVRLAHMGDAYRKFESDVHFYTAKPGENKYLGWAREILSQVVHLPQLAGYDIVQVITPKFFHWKVHMPLMKVLKQFSKALVVVNTTCSNHYFQAVQKLSYNPCADCKLYDIPDHHCVYETEPERLFELKSFALFDAIVSTHYEFQQAISIAGFSHKNFDIALPIDIVSTPLVPFEVGGKMVIYYGETRFGFKGGKYINAALDKLAASEYRDRVEIVRTDKLSFAEYQQVLNRSHIVIDQASSYSAGMNALYAMAKGKIAVTGVEPESLVFAGVQPGENPAINILPDSEQIYGVLVDLIHKDEAELRRLSAASRRFIEQYHSSDVIAQKYLEVYSGLLAHPA